MMSKKDLFIRIIDASPDIKYRIEHTKEGMIVHEKPEGEWQDKSVMQGAITIDGYFTKFYMSLNVWDVADYIQQWNDGIQRLEKCSESCLVIDIDNDGIPVLGWWILYKIRKKVHVQYRVFFGSVYRQLIGNSPFTPETCYDFIPPRETHEEDGTEIAELIIEVNEVNNDK